MRFEKDYWNNRYATGGNSGYGSYDEQLEKKLNWICPLEFESVVELGCGDFNFGKNLLERHPANYIGFDVSDKIVVRNSKRYPQHTFGIVGTDYQICSADLLMCVDVLFHIIDPDEYECVLETLELNWEKYLVLTAYERDEEMGGHVRIRKFDYKRFGEPLVREVVEDDGQLYFYIFKK